MRELLKIPPLLHRQGDSEIQAIVHYENAIRIDPQYADAYNNLGNSTRTSALGGRTHLSCAALLALGDMERVELHYRIALLLEPSHPNAKLNIETFFSQALTD